MSTLLLIDDDPEITSALARGLALHGYETETENRADRALARLQSGAHAGAIVDVMLGADSGIDLVRAARTSGVTLPILMLSALSEVEHRAAGLAAGADDYVVKPFNFDELVARLKVQEHRVSTLRPAPARLSRHTRTLQNGTAETHLTEREYDLLVLLMQHAEAPLPRAAIYEALWAGDGSGHENVVDVYIGYLRKKLAASDFGFEIKTLRNKGFCLTGLLPEEETA
ncbi:Transcriptional regulatory protein PrrA [Roseobacter fucihabitans]|uniref:Transcriptional regulatory protein PrrA n=1 Tax=Roseobacter fucihabitans TaxID=1537242 RepID=A0ABZ2C1C8_9RHOB|nr:response regulator transcription factor [Roseobacter litoralis]MBC6965097.1 Transcriptional regulatory protein PrrA [Roseobacter litoralis]